MLLVQGDNVDSSRSLRFCVGSLEESLGLEQGTYIFYCLGVGFPWTGLHVKTHVALCERYGIQSFQQ